MDGPNFRMVIDWLVNNLGYVPVIIAKDFILCLAGIAIGSIVHSLLSGNVVHKLEKYEKMDDEMVYISMKHEEGEAHFVNPKSFAESVEAWLYLIYMPFFRVKKYTFRDQKRTKRFMKFIYLIWLVLIVLAILFIGHPIIQTPEQLGLK